VSASERLAALEDDRRRWIAGELIPMAAGMKLMKALPEIKAAVKWAETNEPILRGACTELGWNQTPANGIRSALIDLDEALK
jgi:hypothetical protein